MEIKPTMIKLKFTLKNGNQWNLSKCQLLSPCGINGWAARFSPRMEHSTEFQVTSGSHRRRWCHMSLGGLPQGTSQDRRLMPQKGAQHLRLPPRGALHCENASHLFRQNQWQTQSHVSLMGRANSYAYPHPTAYAWLHLSAIRTLCWNLASIGESTCSEMIF